ncbi:oligosaccharyl transferase subunit ost3/OST6 [Kappamyces sp. JEL0680]|nr:oligosaccharyl transferase subunit ost3/OST6 [Kappamyces sp. JEL0680]
MVAMLLFRVLFFLPLFISSYSLQYRWGKLKEIKGNYQELDGKSFSVFTEEPRNYTVFALLTTYSDAHNCVACRPLAIKEKYDKYDLSRVGFKAEPFAAYLSSTFDTKITIHRPIDYTLYVISAIAVFAVIVAVVAVKDVAYKVLSGKSLWTTAVLIFSTVNTGGYMWNNIRNPPFIANDNGRAAFIAGGFQNQFGIETFMVAALYGLVSFSMYHLAVVVPQQRASNQRGSAYAGLLVLYVTFSFLLAVFRAKNGSYPFRLLF